MRSKGGSRPARTATQTRGCSTGSGADALRTAIGKACRAAAIPVFSPHLVGQRKLSVTADTYTHVLVDGVEVEYDRLPARAAA